MKVLRPILLIVGILAMLMGLLWIGQGLGLIMWPRESFMLAERKWSVIGTVLVAIGAGLVYSGRRR